MGNTTEHEQEKSQPTKEKTEQATKPPAQMTPEELITYFALSPDRKEVITPKLIEELSQHEFVPIEVSYNNELRQAPVLNLTDTAAKIIKVGTTVFANKEAIKELAGKNQVVKIGFDYFADYSDLSQDR